MRELCDTSGEKKDKIIKISKQTFLPNYFHHFVNSVVNSLVNWRYYAYHILRSVYILVSRHACHICTGPDPALLSCGL